MGRKGFQAKSSTAPSLALESVASEKGSVTSAGSGDLLCFLFLFFFVIVVKCMQCKISLY